MMGYRIERDYLGEVHVPADAYYGAQTQRAVENFPVSGLRLQKRFIRAHALIKKAAALANMQGGQLDPQIGGAIVRAADEILAGMHDSQFVVDVYQAGAGTSQNMNMNEVLANRAIELLGGVKGDYRLVHPNDHVNMAQSTNDVIHAAIHLAALDALDELLASLDALRHVLDKKAKAFSDILKSGRTHLMDAVPMTLGQEFSGYALAIRNDAERIRHAGEGLLELPLGGTAVGTGLNASSSYQEHAVAELRRLTGKPYRSPSDLFSEMQNTYAELAVSAAVRNAAITLIKIANDIRLLASGPATGLNELTLPAVQPGSSIMPGKVNPVMAEMLDMVGYQVIGNDATISSAAQGSQLELNVMMPVIAYNIVQSAEIFAGGLGAFTMRCAEGIEANSDKCLEYLERNPVIATALTPHIGYEKAAEVAKRAYEEKKAVRDIVLGMKLLSEKELDAALDLRRMTRPGMEQ